MKERAVHKQTDKQQTQIGAVLLHCQLTRIRVYYSSLPTF